MYIKDIHFLEVDILKDEKKIYSGMIEDVPDNMRESEIKNMSLDGKKLVIQI